MRARPLLAAILCLSAVAPVQAKQKLHDMFTDNAVLQRDRPIEIWGTADPAEKLVVKIGSTSVEASADGSGKWRVQLPAMAAGGPFTLTVSNAAGEAQQINDVLIGDVFLCSGQSNMEMQVKASMNAEGEIRNANHPAIRMFNVARASAPQPADVLQNPGAWKIATPANVGDFSAVCYYFARELQPHAKVPIGLINAAWGGSTIEAWIGAEALAATGRADDVALLRLYASDPQAAQAQFGKSWESWWQKRAASEGKPWADKGESGWSPVPQPFRDWKKWGDADLAAHNGMVWFRKSFELTAEQAKQGEMLHLGGIDEIDTTWINGKPLGHSFGWGNAREYAVSPGMLRAGRNEIVTNIYSAWDAGGMYGPVEAIRIELGNGNAVALGEAWQFRKVPKGIEEPPRAPWLAIGGITMIGNAMIAPITPYGLRGALWYQGESNTGNPQAYRALLASLMADWRTKFGNPEMPFMVVELPNFGQPVVSPIASNWSDFREVQRRTVLDDPNAGLAVTIDAGENDDIHPPNKQIVGQRLARLARNLVYKQPVTPNGPVPLSAVRTSDGIAIRFAGFDGRLISRSGTSPIAFEVCGADQSSCRFADATIKGGMIILTAPQAEAIQRVRYCWGDAPICNLYDAAGLPAGPFEIAVQ